jgi:hypothetical protein
LVDWYVQEGQYLNEGWFDNVKDWFGRMGSNVKDAWGRAKGAFGNINNTWGQAGQQYQAGVDQKRDDEAVQQALAAIDQLDQNSQQHQISPDFLNILQQVKSGLQSLNAPAPAPAPTNSSDEEWMNTVHGGSSHESKKGLPVFSEYLKRRV